MRTPTAPRPGLAAAPAASSGAAAPAASREGHAVQIGGGCPLWRW
jgi:hypothetical protein